MVIGERTNANGSRAFRDAMLEARCDDCVEILRGQVRDGAHMIDLCVDYVGRDGAARHARARQPVRDRVHAADRARLDRARRARRPASSCLGGRAVINSVNYEDGDGPDSRMAKVMPMVMEHGAAVIALTIDEEGQARTARVEGPRRRSGSSTTSRPTGACGRRDILIDCLTFPIAHRPGGDPPRRHRDDRGDPRAEGRYPDVQTTLGVSNVSFGLNPAARIVLNSVFLAECVKAGLDSAIVHASKILPMSRIPDEQREVALDLVYDRRREGYDPLQRVPRPVRGRRRRGGPRRRAPRSWPRCRCPSGSSAASSTASARAWRPTSTRRCRPGPPLEIINDTLLDGMKVVGELFGSGEMQLPFVLQSAEVDEDRGRLPRAAHGEGRRRRQGHDRARHRQGRRPRHRQEPRRHHPDATTATPSSTSASSSRSPRSSRPPTEHDADAIGMTGLLVKSTVDHEGEPRRR